MKNNWTLGIIRYVNKERGFGIIEPEHMYSKESIFFHESDLVEGDLKNMKRGSWVEFIEGPERRGQKSATQVKAASPPMETSK